VNWSVLIAISFKPQESGRDTATTNAAMPAHANGAPAITAMQTNVLQNNAHCRRSAKPLATREARQLRRHFREASNLYAEHEERIAVDDVHRFHRMTLHRNAAREHR
jgi:hypothetical protein